MKYPEFVKYPRIPHLGENQRILNRSVEVYEKLDGGNSQIRMHQGRILAGNRANFLTDKHTKFDWFQDFLKWAAGKYDFYNLPENLIVFGEWLSEHTLNYFPEAKNQFYLIDIFNIHSKRFIPYEKSIDLLESLNLYNINFLKPLFKGKITMHGLEKLVGKSDYRNGKMEGVVVKDYKSQQFAKLWESSIYRKKKGVSNQEIRRTVMTIIESGLELNEDNVTDVIVSDLYHQGISYSQNEIRKAVNRYFSNPKNLS